MFRNSVGTETVGSYRGMNQSERGRLKEGGANQSVSMVTGFLRCHSGARGRSLAGPSATLRLEGANQERDAKKRGPIRGEDGDSERTTGELRGDEVRWVIMFPSVRNPK